MFDWANPNTDLFGNTVDAYTSQPTTTAYDSQTYNWADSATSLLGSAVDAYTKIKVADAAAHQQVSPNGVQYVNGQFQAGSGFSGTMLLVGAGLLLILFMKD